MKVAGLETISVYRMLKNFPLEVGDKFIFCGDERVGAAQAARSLVRKSDGLDFVLEQRKIIIIDPETAETSTGRMVEIKEVLEEDD